MSTQSQGKIDRSLRPTMVAKSYRLMCENSQFRITHTPDSQTQTLLVRVRCVYLRFVEIKGFDDCDGKRWSWRIFVTQHTL